MPSLLKHIKQNKIPDYCTSINFYYQDESRFGLKTVIGKCLSLPGFKPKVKYQHRFKNTYLWGSYSPLTGDSFIWEIDGVDKHLFQLYLEAFSQKNPEEFKIIVIDNAGFHSTLDLDIPDNIFLINIPPYSPELNPCEQNIKGERMGYSSSGRTSFCRISTDRRYVVLLCRNQCIPI